MVPAVLIKLLIVLTVSMTGIGALKCHYDIQGSIDGNPLNPVNQIVNCPSDSKYCGKSVVVGEAAVTAWGCDGDRVRGSTAPNADGINGYVFVPIRGCAQSNGKCFTDPDPGTDFNITSWTTCCCTTDLCNGDGFH